MFKYAKRMKCDFVRRYVENHVRIPKIGLYADQARACVSADTTMFYSNSFVYAVRSRTQTLIMVFPNFGPAMYLSTFLVQSQIHADYLIINQKSPPTRVMKYVHVCEPCLIWKLNYMKPNVTMSLNRKEKINNNLDHFKYLTRCVDSNTQHQTNF